MTPGGQMDKDNITQKSKVIYRYKCDRMECDGEYIEESASTFRERLGKISGSFPIYDHANITGYHTRMDNFSTIVRKSHNIARTIKETMYISVTDPSLNRSTGKYQLSHIRDEVLLTPQTSNIK